MSPDHWRLMAVPWTVSYQYSPLSGPGISSCMILRGRGSSASGFIVFIFILPMWMNFLLRTMAWQTLLERNGVINGILHGFTCQSRTDQHPGSIVLGMVYNFLPFMVLPIYNVLAKIDDNTINAAKDLAPILYRLCSLSGCL